MLTEARELGFELGLRLAAQGAGARLNPSVRVQMGIGLTDQISTFLYDFQTDIGPIVRDM